jgi:hypothetical protein
MFGDMHPEHFGRSLQTADTCTIVLGTDLLMTSVTKPRNLPMMLQGWVGQMIASPRNLGGQLASSSDLNRLDCFSALNRCSDSKRSIDSRQASEGIGCQGWCVVFRHTPTSQCVIFCHSVLSFSQSKMRAYRRLGD